MISDHGIEEFCIISKWDVQLPVNPIKLANNIGIIVKTSTDKCTKAFINGNRSIIEYDATMNDINFSIAHAMAHHWLGHVTINKSYVDEGFDISTYSKDEMDANIFATKILICKDVLDYVITKQNMTSLTELSNFFGVSSECMEYRLKLGGWL